MEEENDRGKEKKKWRLLSVMPCLSYTDPYHRYLWHELHCCQFLLADSLLLQHVCKKLVSLFYLDKRQTSRYSMLAAEHRIRDWRRWWGRRLWLERETQTSSEEYRGRLQSHNDFCEKLGAPQWLIDWNEGIKDEYRERMRWYDGDFFVFVVGGLIKNDKR